ncbi:DNA-binding transcriptional LysR family regulator [Aquamicrobium lusatiense]|uniref:DNA-binding transcriptional LysR family regulator n=1 Tax=Aquamicrobium lusatiense TaxID=89772 RepID=A0A7W9S689_9HYPH|nr:LysR family transcriptional regulator [Aquamicrobium lusatiense]MBB6014544.1 DNA-binding transcriptional LysR family regulator [Aquamicrobium lusatiense]
MLSITLRQYEYVVAVAEARSVTAAAARLHVSQPSLSVAISRVEAILGERIFLRRKGSVIVVTPFGHRLVERAGQLLALARGLEGGAEAARPVVLGCFEDIAPWYLAPLLDRLEARVPGLSFRGQEGRFASLARDLAEGRVDVVLSYDIGFDARFERRKLRSVEPVAFLRQGHPLADLPAVTLEQLAAHPLILSSEGLSETYVQSLFEALGLTPQIAHRASSLELMRSFAAHGKGIGISYSNPPGSLSYDGGALVTRPIASPSAAADLFLFWSALRSDRPDLRPILSAITGFF